MYRTQTLKFLTPFIFALIVVSLSSPGLAQFTSFNIITEARGDVLMKRTGRSNWQRARLGDLLNPSDRVRLGRGASLTVNCTNSFPNTVSSAGEFPVSAICPSASSVSRPDSRRAPTRSAQDPTLPYLISPRNTHISLKKPTLRWNPVEGATSYQVRVLGEGVDWSETVNRPEIVYPGQPPLQPGQHYWITITANTGASTVEEEPVGFTLLTSEEARRVIAERAKIQQQPLSVTAKTLALAYLYQSYDLNHNAILLLKDAIANGEQTPAVYHLLGHLYFNIGLGSLAAERYLTALELMKTEENLEAQAEIQENLGEIEEARARLKEALLWYREAQESYRQLGDEAKVQELQPKIDDFSRRFSE